MTRHVEAARAHARTNLSTANWRGRAFRIAAVAFGFWMALGGIGEGTGWQQFGAAISTPWAVMGLILALGAAATTTGRPR